VLVRTKEERASLGGGGGVKERTICGGDKSPWERRGVAFPGAVLEGEGCAHSVPLWKEEH